MRVFYPISARISDFANEGAGRPAGWMMLWSGFCVALLVLVLLALPSFESGAADKQHEFFTSTRFNHTAHTSATHAKHCINNSRASNTTTQDYIDAHHCALSVSCFGSVKASRLPAAPAVSKAGGDRYL